MLITRPGSLRTLARTQCNIVRRQSFLSGSRLNPRVGISHPLQLIKRQDQYRTFSDFGILHVLIANNVVAGAAAAASSINTTTSASTVTSPAMSTTTTNMAPPKQPLPTSMVAQQLPSASPMEENLKLNQIAPVPVLKANQTLVKVLTSALNPVDYKLAEISVIGRLAIGYPVTPGMDYAGRVWATTLPDSAGIRPGDLVFGSHDMPVKAGTLGEFTVLTGPEGVAKCPDGVELDELAGVGVAGLTAYQSLVPYVGLDGRGKSVFINGGSGGTGTMGVQIAKKGLGCTVVTSCSGANVSLCKELGADEVIDYRSQDVRTELKKWVQKNGGKKFDVIVDNVGADLNLYWQCQEYLNEGCSYVNVGGAVNLSTIKRVLTVFLWPGLLGGGQRKFVMLGCKPKRDELTRIGQWMKEGKVKVMIDETFELKDSAKAFKKLKTGRTRGKVVVRVSEAGRGDGS